MPKTSLQTLEMAVLRQHGTIVIAGVLEKEKGGTVWGQYFNGTTPAARKKPPSNKRFMARHENGRREGNNFAAKRSGD